MKEYIKTEILNGYNLNIFQFIKTIIFNLNKRFIFFLRMSLYPKKSKWWIKILIEYSRIKLTTQFGCFIDYNAKIGSNIKFPHPNGIIIGSGVEIGSNCIIYQQVTLGGKIIGDAQNMNYPKIGNNVTIFAGAKVIGNIIVGDHVIIGANSVVNKDVPPFSVVAGIPATIIKKLNQDSIE